MLALLIFVYFNLQKKLKGYIQHCFRYALSDLRMDFQPDHRAFSMMWQWLIRNRYDHLHLTDGFTRCPV